MIRIPAGVPALLALALALSATPLRAHRWVPYSGDFVVSETGGYFVDIKSDLRFSYGRKTRASGRRVLARGKVLQPPLHVLVPGNGLGFVAIDKHYGPVPGDAVIWYDPQGRVKVRLALADLKFEKEFARGFGITWWLDGYWIDEAKRHLVLASLDNVLRTVAYDTGAVGSPDDAILYEALDSGGVLGRRKALELIFEKGLKAAPRHTIERILEDKRMPEDVRLRAAAVLTSMGFPAGKALVSALLAKGTKNEENYRLAVEFTPVFFEPAEAMDILSREIHVEEGNIAWAAMEAFIGLGEKAVPALTAILREEPTEQNASARGWSALGRLRPAADKRLTAL